MQENQYIELHQSVGYQIAQTHYLRDTVVSKGCFLDAEQIQHFQSAHYKNIAVRSISMEESCNKDSIAIHVQKTSKKTVGAMILMGGMSSRMPEQNKLLLPMGRETIASCTAQKVIEAGFYPVVVVTGFEAEEIRATLKNLDVVFVHNEHFEHGMGTSIQAGMKTVEDWAGVLIAMGDMPFVSVDILTSIRTNFQCGNKAIVAPSYRGKRGQPVLFSSFYFEELQKCCGDVGGKMIIQNNKEHVFTFEVSQSTVHSDVDTQNDLDVYKGKFGVC